MTTPVDPRADLGTFTAVRGDPFTLPFLRELDAAGDGVELSNYGSTFTSELRYSPDSVESVSFTVDQSNIAGTVNAAPDAYRLVLSLDGATTESMTRSTYYFDVQVTGGPVSPFTPYRGRLSLVQDITRA